MVSTEKLLLVLQVASCEVNEDMLKMFLEQSFLTDPVVSREQRDPEALHCLL